MDSMVNIAKETNFMNNTLRYNSKQVLFYISIANNNMYMLKLKQAWCPVLYVEATNVLSYETAKHQI